MKIMLWIFFRILKYIDNFNAFLKFKETSTHLFPPVRYDSAFFQLDNLFILMVNVM